MTQQVLHFGPDVTPADAKRLGRQLEAVREVMKDGEWITLKQLVRALGGMGIVASEAGVSARIRDLRKQRFGAREIDKERVEGGLWRYRMIGQ